MSITKIIIEHRLEAAEKVLEHRFRSRSILLEAITHRSFANESKDDMPDNDRLEFLGDAVLGYAVADRLYRARPLESEDVLSILRASLVRKESLAEIGARLGLGEAIRLGAGERNSGGYSIEIDGITEHDGYVLATVVLTEPGDGCMITQAITNLTRPFW